MLQKIRENEKLEKERIKQDYLLFLKSNIDKQIKANSLMSKNKMRQISCKKIDDENKRVESEQKIQLSNSFSHAPNPGKEI